MPTTPSGLPRDDDGFVVTSADFGQHYLVRISYNTDFDGRQIDPGKEEYPQTFHGPFDSEAEAVEWMESYPDGDTDIAEMESIVANRVRPAAIDADGETDEGILSERATRRARGDVGYEA